MNAISNAAMSNIIPNAIPRGTLTLEASFKGASLERLAQSIAVDRQVPQNHVPKNAEAGWDNLAKALRLTNLRLTNLRWANALKLSCNQTH
jgi:hypothetical protein